MGVEGGRGREAPAARSYRSSVEVEATVRTSLSAVEGVLVLEGLSAALQQICTGTEHRAHRDTEHRVHTL